MNPNKLIVIVLISILKFIECEPLPGAENVCNNSVFVKKEIM